MDTRHGRALSMIAALLLLTGCSTPRVHPHMVTYQFENVRQSDSSDEWLRVRRVLERHATGEIEERVVHETSFGGKHLRTYRVGFLVSDLPVLIDIQRDLDGLRRKDEGAGNAPEFELLASALTYRSNFVAVGADIVLRGVTIPSAMIHLRVGPRAYQTRADAQGAWSQVLSVAPQNPFVYGYSRDPTSRATRYFRLNILSQREEAITEATFRKMYPRDPIPADQEEDD